MLKFFRILDAPYVSKRESYEQMEELLRFFPNQKCFDEYNLVKTEPLY